MWIIAALVVGYLIGRYKVIEKGIAMFQEWRKKKNEDMYGARY